jgi:hypothetical protein
MNGPSATNPALSRSLRALSHPINIAAVGVLLLNDHVLRRWWPSWITGKLGDVAWLAFFPLIMALVFALIVPARVKRRDQVVAGLAFGFTALLFTLGKTVPAVHALIVAVLGAILRIPIGLRLDPTDLITFPALWIGWRVWNADRGVQPRTVTGRGWVVMALGALATMANTVVYDMGITCIQEDGSKELVAFSNFFGPVYKSSDGGFTWVELYELQSEQDITPESCRNAWEDEPWTFTDPENDSIVYEFTPGERIMRSEDRGEHWQRELDFTWTDAEQNYYLSDLPARISPEVPVNAIFHESTRHLVAAMGYEGVLVRTPDGEWHWADVGPYRHVSMKSAKAVTKLLRIELVLASLLAVLAIAFLHSMSGQASKTEATLTIISSIAWLTGCAIFPGIRGLHGVLLVFVYPVFIPLIIVTGIRSLRHISFRDQSLPALAVIAAPVLFLLPFLLWSQNIIAHYDLAQFIALVLALITLIAGAILYRRRVKATPASEQPHHPIAVV